MTDHFNRLRLILLAKESTVPLNCACLRRELPEEPDEGNPHVRFDEGRMVKRLASTTRLLYRVGRRLWFAARLTASYGRGSVCAFTV